MLRDISPGTHCFVEANIFYHHLVEPPPLSEECSNFFERVERGEITASTSSVAVAEAIHKVMLADAVAQHNLDRVGLAHRLQRHRQQIATLTEHTKVTALVRALSIHVEPITLSTLERAAVLSSQFQLLTNDALTLAVMEQLGLKDLATNDENFDTAGMTIWKPRWPQDKSLCSNFFYEEEDDCSISHMAKCWAAQLGDCSQKQSHEHYITQGLFTNKEITIKGFEWLEGEEKTFNLSSLTANILCARHNNQLSPVDQEAIKLFRMLDKISLLQHQRAQAGYRPWFKKERFQTNGIRLERWAAKTLTNLMCDSFKEVIH